LTRSTESEIDTPRLQGADADRRTATLVLILLVVLGACLRIVGLGSQSLWVDELLTIKAASIGGSMGVRDFLTNIQGPLHALIIHVVGRYSTSEAALRAVSAAAGIAMIPVVYLLGREMVDRRTGLVAAGLAAVSPFAIWYSQEVRNYSLLMFLSAVATLAVWRIVVAHRRAQISYVVSIVLGLYSNLSAAFLWLAHTWFAVGRLTREKRLRQWVVVCVVVGLMFVPLAVALTRWVRVDSVAQRVTVAPLAADEDLLRGDTTFSPMAIPYSLFTMVYGYALGPGAAELHVGSPLHAFVKHAWLAGPAGLVAALALLAGLSRLLKRGAAGRLALAVIVVPLVATAILAITNIKPFNVRYAAVMLPIVLVTLGAGVTAFPGRRGAWLCAIVVLFSLLSFARYRALPAYQREDVRAAARYVKEHEKPGDIVLVPVVRDVFTFYFEGAADDFVLYRGQTRSSADILDVVRERTEGHRRLWFVNSRLWHMDPGMRTPAALDGAYPRLDRVGFAGVKLSLYDLSGSE
jgi:uncharacterized membrane protein